MVKILEIHQQVYDPSNKQSRVLEFESFAAYLEQVESGLPSGCEIYKKHVDEERENVTILLELNQFHKWVEYLHYAQVIDC